MLRSYRSLILAIGLILAGAGPPDGKNVKPKPIEQVEPAPAPTPDYTPYPKYNPDPCYRDKNHDSADLCAQWRAALAAEKAAKLALWGNWIAGIAAILSFGSIILVICALRQTDKSLLIAQKDRASATRRAMAQAEETEIALRAARKSANAMTKVAQTLKEQSKFVAETTANSKQMAETQQRIAGMQMRAYLTVESGSGLFQEREKGIKFESRPLIINTGNTPARNLSFSIAIDVLPYPPPESHNFPDAPPYGRQGIIPQGQNRFMSAVYPHWVADEDVLKVMSRNGLALYVWGRVNYTDEFGVERITNFGLIPHWQVGREGEPLVIAEYIPGMNEST